MKNVLKSLEIMEKELAKVKSALAGDITEAVETEAPAVDLDNLDSMNLKDLKKIAEDAGIEFAKSIKKPKLIEAILAFYEDEEEDEEEEDEDADEEEEDDSEEDEEEEDEDEEGEEYTEEDLDELDDEELLEVAEDFELDPAEFQKGKGKKKKLDRDALIEAILEAQEEAEEDEEEDEDEDESDEDNLEFLEDEELEELSLEELVDHHTELVDYMEESEIEVPKAGKIKKNAKAPAIRKAIVALYDAIEEAEEDEE